MELSDPPWQDQSSQSHIPSDDLMQSSSGRKRVGFTSDTAAPASPTPDEYAPNFNPFDHPLDTYQLESGPGSNTSPASGLRPDVSHAEIEQIHRAFGEPYIPKPRPAIRRTTRTPPAEFALEIEEGDNAAKRQSGIAAQERATKLARTIGSYSAPGSRRNSNDTLLYKAQTPPVNSVGRVEDIPLEAISREQLDEGTDDDDESFGANAKQGFLDQAEHLIRQHTLRRVTAIRPEDLYHSGMAALRSGQVTPVNEAEIDNEYVPRPTKFRTGVLGTLLKAANGSPAHRANMTQPKNGFLRPSIAPRSASDDGPGTYTFSGASTAANTPQSSPPNSGSSTPSRSHRGPRHWYSKSANPSAGSVSKLIESSSMLATPAQRDLGQEMVDKYRKSRPDTGKRPKGSTSIASAFRGMNKPSREEQIKIKIHLAGTLARQTYLRRLCKALMMYGAPTHRLEEYMNMSARVLEIEAQFLYIPGCMIISFDDSSVHTTEVKLVRVAQGVDLGKLRDTHEIYKDVVHDRVGVDEATPRLEAIIARKPKFNAWLRVPVYGLASATVGPFAFQARPIDLPVCFVLGCFLGWLQLIVAPGNEMISNVFEISAAVITSFVARGLGSIRHDGKEIFCFSAMAQSSIALILPGFTVLSASLELQSRHIVAGSVRMVYAIIYSLFLGFGITIGTVLFGMMDKNATSSTSCSNPMSSHWYYLFVLAFTLCLIIINQAKWRQAPAMLVIALIGYVINYHSSQYFTGNAQVSNTLGALAIGVTANLNARFGRHVENRCLDLWEDRIRPRLIKLRKRYLRAHHGPKSPHPYHRKAYRPQSGSSTPETTTPDEFVPSVRKIGYGLAAASMLPAIFVQVPSGLSVSGSLVSGITSADQITRNTTGVTTLSNGTDATSSVNDVALNVGFSVIQVAIGITVGLFLAALLVYPLGKKRSGLFSF